MPDRLDKLWTLHERMNGEAIPLEVYFQSCPDFMFMIRNTDRRIKHVNGTVTRMLGMEADELRGRPITEFLIFDEPSPLPNGNQGHARFLAKLKTEAGDPLLLDFNSTYLSEGNFTIITGRYPLTR